MPRITIRAASETLATVFVASVALSGCSLLSNDPDATASGDDPTPGSSASPSPTEAPSVAPSASPSLTPGPTEGPIVGEPPGTPVVPEIFLATVDEAAGLLRVIVIVPNIYEDGGSCIVTVKAGSVTLLEENTGAADATSTACGQFTFTLADLPTGNASVMAHYESNAHLGASGAMTVVIP